MEKLENINNGNPLKRNTVNSNLSNSYTVNSNAVNGNKTLNEKIEELLEEEGIQSEGAAQRLAEMLDDTKSVRYYQLLVKEHGAGRLIEIAYDVKDRARNGEIRTTKAAYFQGILRKLKMKKKFKLDT